MTLTNEFVLEHEDLDQENFETESLYEYNATNNNDELSEIESLSSKKVEESVEFQSRYLSDHMAGYLKEIAKYQLLSNEEVCDLARKAKEGDTEAREKIFLHNLKLVVYVAKKYMKHTKTLTELDIIMEGNFGLLKAIDRFDPDKGFKFATYAYHWIRQSITRAIMDGDTIIRIPVHMSEQVYRYARVVKEFQDETNSNVLPPKEYVVEKLGCNDFQYSNIISAYFNANTDSLNRAISTDIDESSEMIDFIADENFDISAVAENKELAEKFDELIERFLERGRTNPANVNRNRDILYKRFGLHGRTIQTLEAIGDYHGLTRERVRQVEARFIKFCRTGKAYTELKQFL